ncbi:MAG: hypothetical protein ACI35W_01435 [Anaeroplasmataceae bacterium]
MTLVDISIIIIISLIVAFIIGSYIYKRKKGILTGECACCHTRMRKAMKKAMRDIGGK